MTYVKSLRCVECGREYKIEPIYVCEFCFGPLEVTYDYERIKRDMTRQKIESRPHNMWRYRSCCRSTTILSRGSIRATPR